MFQVGLVIMTVTKKNQRVTNADCCLDLKHVK